MQNTQFDTLRDYYENRHYYESVNGGEPACIDEQIPFDIPDSWEWVRLSSYCQYGEAPSIKGTEITSGYWVLDLEDIEAQTGKILKKVVSENRKSTSNKYLFSKDMVLYSKLRPYLNKVVVAPSEGCCTTEIIPICLFSEASPYFLQMLMMSPMFVDSINADSYGVKMPRADTAQVKSFLLPIPPQKEQLRIVARAHALQPYLVSYKERKTYLDSLNADFSSNLKKSILQHAIQGKLVPQNPNDEPASVLLERIAKERTKMGKKSAKSMSRIERRDRGTYEIFPDGSEKDISEEIPFDIPDSWEWSRLSSVLQIARGGSPRPIKDYLTSDKNGVNWIKIGDATKGSKYIFTTREKIKPEGIAKSRLVNPGDFLLSNSMSFGRPYILKTSGCIHDGWLVLSGVELCFNVDFLFYLLSTPLAKSQFAESAAGAVVQNLNIAKVENAIFPIPPMEEQVRIQAAISDLFADIPI